jgi:hypothetical protein
LEVVLLPHDLEIIAARIDDGNGHVQVADAIRFVFGTDWVPRHLLQYFHKENDTADAMAGRWILWKIVEYRENGTQPGYDPDGDTLVSDYKLWLTDWSSMLTGYSTITNTDGTVIHQVCTSLQGPIQPAPTVQLCVQLANAETVYHGIQQDPNAVKWSILISNYPYKANDTLLALKFSLSTRQAVADFNSQQASQFQQNSDENAMVLGQDTNGNMVVGGFVTTVNVTGTGCAPTAPIVRSIIRTGQWSGDVDIDFPAASDPDNIAFDGVLRIGYFSFLTNCQPQSVLHDPQLGAAVTPASSSTGGIVVPSVMFALFALLALFL